MRLTQTGFVAGTPLYMAPEQARGEPLDQRTDLFSLGGVLYAMCTGQPPFEASTPYLVLRRVTDEQPRPIGEVNPSIPDWLIGLIDRLLAKNPADRIQSVAEVAEILSQHLRELQTPPPIPAVTRIDLPHRSVRATPPTTATGTAQLAWWQAVLVGAGTFVFLLGTLLASERLGWTHLLAGRDPSETAGIGQPAARATLQGNAGAILATAFAPDDQALAMGIDDGTVKLWDLTAVPVRVARTLRAHQGPVWSVAYSPDGAQMATASDDGTVKIWETSSGKELKVLTHDTAVRAVAFSPAPLAGGADGMSPRETLATGSRNGKVRLWDARTGEEIGSFKGHRTTVMSIMFSPDGRTLATASSDKTVKLWDVASGQEQLTLRGHTGAVYAVAFAPDGKTLASGGLDSKVRLWDTATGNPLGVLTGHGGDVWSLAFSPDNRLLGSVSEDHTLKLWDLAGQREVITYKGHAGMAQTVTFSHDSRTVASGGRDGAIKLWDVPAGWASP
jgi:eukaryotic-like serine/threonine-protein kinase